MARRAADFAPRVLAWFEQNGRHDLPWQHPRSAYRVWIAEVMLQQTQVATVVPYFARFVAALPDVNALAAAPLDQVLALWSGLGYYSRARNLHRAAQQCVTEHDAELPRLFDALIALPGIGRSTAGAIAAQAYGQRNAILDGNVKRVLARFTGETRDLKRAPALNALWAHAEALLPPTRMAEYTQAMMDLGATVCTARGPRCAACPLNADCRALATDSVDSIPFKSPRRRSPLRHTHWLVEIDRDGRVLLERRPPVGVWPSLWSFPEIAGADDGADADPPEARSTRVALAPFRHVFTHFKLDVQPWLVRQMPPRRELREGPEQAWFTRAQALGLGLPQPVRKLLLDLAE